MAQEPVTKALSRTDRVPPHSEEAERGVLGSVLLDAVQVMDLCIERGLTGDSFYVPAHRSLFNVLLDMSRDGTAVDVLTVAEELRRTNRLEAVGGALELERLIDSTPTAAHAEYYIDIVRQKHLLRSIIACAREAEGRCYGESQESADALLNRTEQAFLEINERQRGSIRPWTDAVKATMQRVEDILDSGRGLSGISTGFVNLDRKLHGLRTSEMVVLAARPSMGKTSLAMNIASNVALGRGSDRQALPVAIFSLEMSQESLALRMLCAEAQVNSFDLSRGFVADKPEVHGRLTQAASVLSKTPIYLDDSGGLDILDLRARARRMFRKYGIRLIVIDYLQLLRSREYGAQGRQVETADISGNLKAMAKELRLPVLVLSQLSRAPEQRDKLGKPKLSDLRDSGAIEQDADVVCMLRRPCKYPDDEESGDETLAVLDVAKNRNGPTGEVKLNFTEEYTVFTDRDTTHGVDGIGEFEQYHAVVGEETE